MSVATAIIGFGAGGHAKVVVEALRAAQAGSIVALVDVNPALWGSALLGAPIVGGDDRVPALVRDGATAFFVGLGSVGDHRVRQRLFELGLSYGLTAITAVHPSVVLSPSAAVGSGAALLPGAIVNAGAVVGENAIINTGAIVEHDCQIGAHAHVATGARLSGGVVVGNGAHVGVGASVRQGVRIGDGAIVGAGAVVVADVQPGVTVVGVPAKPMQRGAVSLG